MYTTSTLTILTFLFYLAYSVSVEKDLTLTYTQKQALDKFRERVAPLLVHDYMKLDIYLVRWLRARDFNLDAAELMLNQTLNWRKELNIDHILKEDFSDIFAHYPSTMDTYDKDGRPILVLDTSEWNVRRAVIQGLGKRLFRYIVHNFEYQTQQVFKELANGQNVTQWKVLINAETFNLVEYVCAACIPFWFQGIDVLDKYYNGWIDEFIIIQATPAVKYLLDYSRPLFSRPFRETLRVFGSNRAQWMKYLDEKISREERYPAFGGTKTPDA